VNTKARHKKLLETEKLLRLEAKLSYM